MYLKRLQILGFKSFGKEVTFTFDRNLNIIVGPNGSGKSNIIDAVKWLFGEAKYKSMRLDRPDSVLFNGNDSLAPAKFAKVQMIIDNSDEEIADFGKDISIMRTYRKGDSKYYIDDKRVNLRDIKSFISDKGLGKEFYSIISQGKITELVKSGGKSMKNLLDQAAGITPFYQKKDEALRNLEQTQQNLLRLGDIIKEIASRKNTLHLQAKRAEKYLHYKREFNNYKATKVSFQLNDLEEKISVAKESIANLQKTLLEKQMLLKEKSDKLEDYRNKYSKIDKIMRDLTSSIDSLRQKEDVFNRKLERTNKDIAEKTLKRDNLQYQITSNKKGLDDLHSQLNKVSNEVEMIQKDLKVKEKDYLDYDKKRKALTDRVDEIQKISYSLQDDIFKLKTQFSDLKSSLESRDRSLKSIDNDIQNTINDIENNRHKIEQSKEKMFSYSEKIKEYENIDKELKDKIMKKDILLHNLKHKFEDVNASLNKLNLDLSSLKEQFNMNQRWLNSYEGYSKAVRILFREVKKINGINVMDTVANVIKPLDGYELAINALISGRLQNVITKTSKDAKDLISILKQHKAGRITFLPLDLINGNLYSTNKPPKSIDFARNLIKYDKKYEKIINFIFTNSVVVKDLDDAISLKKDNYKGKIATLKGDVIQSGGAITGGSTDEHSLNLMNRQKILDDLRVKITEIESKMNEKTMELSRISVKMNETSDEIKALKNESESYKSDYDRYKNQLELYSEMISNYEDNIEKLEKKLQSLEKIKPNLQGEMSDLKSKLSYIQSTISDNEKKREDVKMQMDSIIEEYKKIDNETSLKKREYESIKDKYESKVKEIEHINTKINEAQEFITNSTIELNSLTKTIDSLNDDAFYIKQDIEKVKESIDAKLEEMKSNSDLKSKGAELLQSIRDEVKTLEKEVDELKDKFNESQLSMKEYQVRIEDLKIALNEIEYDEIYDMDIEKLDESMKDLENKLKHIGSVNLNAFDEYKEVSKRYDEYEEQKRDIISAKEKIEQLIMKLDEEAKSKFISSLEKIQSHFNDMMEILFNGGGGEIILTNPNDVLQTEVDIAVKIPHKKIKSLYAMSGGEQTLIGVALMFAFLKTNPSPFYILDEIDANLDSANTERISSLLKALSKETQFIVITHNKIMMDIAKTIYGITMEKGLTKAISVNL